MPIARWHQGADFAQSVLPKTRLVQLLPPSIDRIPLSGALPRASARRGTICRSDRAFQLQSDVPQRGLGSRRVPE
jgi:hypothetical protein